MNFGLYCLCVVLSCASTLLVLFSTLFHHKSMRLKQMSALKSINLLLIVCNSSSLLHHQERCHFVYIKAHLGREVSTVDGLGRTQMSGLSVEFLLPFTSLSHLKD